MLWDHNGGSGRCPVRVASAGVALCLPFHVPSCISEASTKIAKVVSKGHALPTSFFPRRLTSPCASLCCAGTSDPAFYCMGASSSASGGGHAVSHVGPVSAASFRNMWTGTCKAASVLRPLGSTGRRVASFFRLLYCSRERLGLLASRARRLAHVTH